ncbi:MAG: transcription-repair coupling factor [Clostridia bacterium]|nr:transcription-repair coupling factor [Clostridia bacterium]
MLDEIFSLKEGTSIYEIVSSVRNHKNTGVIYCAQNNRIHISTLIKRPFIYLATDWIDAERIYERINEYGDGKYAILKERDDYLIKKVNINHIKIGEKMRNIIDFVMNDIDGLVVPVSELLKYFPAIDRLEKAYMILEVGEEKSPQEIIDNLIYSGYERIGENVENPGEFFSQGDRLEIYPYGETYPVRIEFFGDEIESIKPFFPDTKLMQEGINAIPIYPCTDILISQKEAEKTVETLNKSVLGQLSEIKEIADEYVQSIELNKSNPLNYCVIPIIKDAFTSILSYLPKDGVLIYDDVKLCEEKCKLVYKEYQNRAKELISGSKFLSSCKNYIMNPTSAFNTDKTVLGFLRATSQVNIFTLHSLYTYKSERLPQYYNDFSGFLSAVNSMLILGYKVRICARDSLHKKIVIERFSDFGLYAEDSFDNKEYSLCVDVKNISYGFILKDQRLALIGVNDISQKVNRERKNVAIKKEFELPKPGDYVVHESYGIGLSEGIVKIDTFAGPREVYSILYKDGNRLYLPLDDLDGLEKYTGEGQPKLTNLGSGEFEKVKNKIRESVKKLAINLLEVYRERYTTRGYKYPEDDSLVKEFEEDFEYVETPDQLKAIADVKKDMMSGKIMDRLICGDVGFGKTEVAMRAIFKTALEDRQTAFLCPTTILAQQHYNVLKQRFDKYGIKVELLSRFIDQSELKKSIKRIKSGESLIAIGTHRLLSTDIEFKNLGLLVLDEEQRFGVEQKEKIKSLRRNVNVLSMSATPIPRTLNMSLTGVRDISIILTPPNNRLPVDTYVMPYDDDILAEAIKRELDRDGQVYVLYNRVATIASFYKKLLKITGLTENEVVYAHGKMNEFEMENAVKKFYDGDAKVLVSTTIIENGIDIPKANTLFVMNADTLGISQMYQLRGRVGRSNSLAYAYFTYSPEKHLTPNAIKRFDAIMNNVTLGSGYSIAMRDLEIRGAGNLFGAEQSGNMQKVGYHLYVKLMNEGIKAAKGELNLDIPEPILDIDGIKMIDIDYIKELQARVQVYKAIAEIDDISSAKELLDEVIKAYGENASIRYLIKVALIRSYAKKLELSKVIINNKGTGIYLRDNKLLTEKRLFDALAKFKDKAVLVPNDKEPAIIFKKGKKNIDYIVSEVLVFITTWYSGSAE